MMPTTKNSGIRGKRKNSHLPFGSCMAYPPFFHQNSFDLITTVSAAHTYMKWMIPLNRLDSQQDQTLSAVTKKSPKRHWIAGYAGTGKTIVLTHALEKLASDPSKPKICFMAYTYSLKDLVESGLSERARRRITSRVIDTFNKSPDHYDYIFVDEIQDIKEEQIRRLLHHADNVVVAGDPDQSIFLGRIDPDGVGDILGRHAKHVLQDIQRFGKTLFDLAKSILPEAKIIRGAQVSNKDPHRVYRFKARSKNHEFIEVFREAQRLSSPEQPSAVLFPTRKLIHEFAYAVGQEWCGQPPPEPERNGLKLCYEKFNAFFQRKKVALRFLGSDNGSLPESDDVKIVYLMTYHSAKGLDFDHVFLPHLTTVVNLDAKDSRFSSSDRERRHFFVALTRSKKNLYLSYHGAPHWIWNKIPERVLLDFVPEKPARGFKR